MVVQPQQAATVCEFDPVQHTIGSLERAQTLDPNPRPENSHGPLNLTLDLKHAHVSDRWEKWDFFVHVSTLKERGRVGLKVLAVGLPCVDGGLLRIEPSE